MLSEEKLTELFRYSFSLIDSRMTPNQQAFCRAIESAATAPLLARIAKLDRSLDVMSQNTEAQAHASVMLEIELTEKVEKLERELEEARKDAELLDWMEKNIRAHAAVWVLPCGDDLRFVQVRHFGDCASYPVAEGVRQAIRAAIKEQT